MSSARNLRQSGVTGRRNGNSQQIRVIRIFLVLNGCLILLKRRSNRMVSIMIPSLFNVSHRIDLSFFTSPCTFTCLSPFDWNAKVNRFIRAFISLHLISMCVCFSCSFVSYDDKRFFFFYNNEENNMNIYQYVFFCSIWISLFFCT